MFSRDWLFWLIVIAVVAIPNLLSKLRSAGKGAAQPAASLPRPKRKQPSQPQPVSGAKPPLRISAKPQVATDQLRDVLQQLEQMARDEVQRVLRQPEQPEQPLPPVAPAAAAVREVSRKPAPAAKAPSLSPQPAALAESQPRRASAWAEALSDKQTLRRIIILAEIIGPPRGV